jgi:hypothetical protein
MLSMKNVDGTSRLHDAIVTMQEAIVSRLDAMTAELRVMRQTDVISGR